MSSTVDHVLLYPEASVRDVHDMLASPAFRERVCEFQGDLRHMIRIERDHDRMDVEVDRVQASNGVPSFARSFVGEEINFVQREVWSTPAKASLSIAIPGKPGQITGTLVLSEVRGTLEEHVRLNVKVGLPLIGGRLEALIGELLVHAMRAENHVGKKWLAESR